MGFELKERTNFQKQVRQRKIMRVGSECISRVFFVPFIRHTQNHHTRSPRVERGEAPLNAWTARGRYAALAPGVGG